MSSNWETLKVQDILYTTDYVANGSFASLKENVKYLNKQDYAILIRLVDFNSSWNGDFVYVDKKSYDFLKKSYVEPKDVIISNVGANVGTVFQAPNLNQPMTLGPNSVLVKPAGDNIDRDFVYYFFTSPIGQSKLSSIVSGSAQPKFNKTDLRNIEFPLPPLPIQKKIAHILSTLDDKIELNRKMNQTLEEMASAIFKSWFVNFDPVHAKANCESEAELENIAKELGISKEILDLFPSEFTESEMGMIPKGWEVKAISSIGQVITGKTPPTTQKENYGDRYPFITIPDMHNQVYITKTERYLSDVGNNVQKNKLIPKNSLIVSCIATVGLISINSEDSHTNQQINSIVCDEKNLYYLYFILKNMKKTLIMYGSSGTATLNVNKSTFENIEFIKSSDILIQRFFKFVNPIFGDILENTKQIQILEKTRDTLLPKLLSGEIDVSELEIK
ncbi:restriction endonuclease subunit S [Aliarcobacter skirrowii]|nr:restriction endonuclease subunit S [Aliarcobacter skirrowii]